MIFSYLPLRDLLKCHRVNRQWRAILASDPTLYRSLDLTNSSTGKPLNVRNVQALLRYSGGDIRSLKIRKPEQNFSILQLNNFKSQATLQLVPLFKNLEQLHIIRNDANDLETGFESSILLLASLNFMRHLNIEPLLFFAELRLICKAAQQLESLAFSIRGSVVWTANDLARMQFSAASVKQLTIRVTERLHPSFLHVLGWFPGVEGISLIREGSYIKNYLTEIPPLEIDCQSRVNTARIYGLPQPGRLSIKSANMKRLEVFNCPFISVDIPAQSTLEELMLDTVPSLSPEILKAFLDSATTMKRLTIASVPRFEVRHVEHLLHEGVNLKFININSLRYVNDTTLQLLHSLKNLERLHVDDCPGITGQGIIRLVENLCIKRGGQLTAISVKGNESIRRQTIDWARNYGVIISI
jgi:F-box-like